MLWQGLLSCVLSCLLGYAEPGPARPDTPYGVDAASSDTDSGDDEVSSFEIL